MGFRRGKHQYTTYVRRIFSFTTSLLLSGKQVVSVTEENIQKKRKKEKEINEAFLFALCQVCVPLTVIL